MICLLSESRVFARSTSTALIEGEPFYADAFRRAFAPYYATPVYNRFLAWAGYDQAAAQIREGWAQKDRAMTAAALSDELIDEIGVIGTEEEVQERICADADAGIHTQIIAPIPCEPGDMQRTFDAFRADRFSFHG